MNRGRGRGSVSGGQAPNLGLKTAANASKGAPPSKENQGTAKDSPAGATKQPPPKGNVAVNNNSPANANKGETKQLPTKDIVTVKKEPPANAVKKEPPANAIKKEPSANANKGDTKPPPAQVNKSETKQPPAQANEGEAKESPPKDIVAIKKEPPASANKGDTQETVQANMSKTKQPPAEANKGETQQPPSKDDIAIKKEPPTNANKGETKQPPAQANKDETKQPPTEGNKVAPKEPPVVENKAASKAPAAETNKSASIQPAVETSKGAPKESPAEASKDASKQDSKPGASKQPTAETTKEPLAQANKGTAKETPAAEGIAGASNEPVAVASKEPAAESNKGTPKAYDNTKPPSEAYYFDEFGVRKRFCGAGRKRFKWLLSKGFSAEEARGLAQRNMLQLQPISQLKRNFAEDDELNRPPPWKKSKKPLRKDRNFKQPPDVVKPPVGGLRLGIIGSKYPDGLLTNEQLKLLKDTVTNKLVPEKQGTFKPTVLDSSIKPGFIIFHCEDKATVLWLKTVVRKLQGTVGVELRALEEYQIPRKLVVVGYFPNKRRENIDKIFEYIKEGNEGLNVDSWVLHKLMTIKGITQTIIAVDHNSAEKLMEMNFKITFKNREVELKPDEKFYRNLEATVYIPKQDGSIPWNKWWNPKLPRPPKFDPTKTSVVAQGANITGIPPTGNAPIPQPRAPPQPVAPLQPMIPPQNTYGVSSWNAGAMAANPGPPHNPMWGTGPANTMFPVVPPQVQMVPQQWIPPSNAGPSSFPGPAPRNETHFAPQMMEPDRANRQPPRTEQRDQGYTRGSHSNFASGSQDEMQLASQNRNLKNVPQCEAERPTYERPPGNYPTRPSFNEADRPPRDVSGDRGIMRDDERPPWSSGDGYSDRGSAIQESAYVRRPHNQPQRDPSPEADSRRWGGPRGRYSDRGGSPSEDDGNRFARSRDRPSNRGPDSAADRRPRSRSRHSPVDRRRFDAEADRQQWVRSRDSYQGPDVERPSRETTLGSSERRSAIEADRHPRDGNYSNRGSLTVDERPPYSRPRDDIHRGPGIETDMHQRRMSQGDYRSHGPANQVPPSSTSPAERFSNRAPKPDVIRRPWDRPQENYLNQGSEIEDGNHPRGMSRDGYPNRKPLTEDERPPWAMTRDSYSNRNEASEPERLPRDTSRGRSSNRGSITEDDRWISRDRSLNRSSGNEGSRPPWDAPQERPPRGRSRERRPNPAADDRPPWARQDSNVIIEANRPEWAGPRDSFPNRGSANEGNRRPRSKSREEYQSRGSAVQENRQQWAAASEDTFERRGRETETRGSQWGPSGDRFLNRGAPVGVDNSTRGAPRDNFSNRAPAMEVDERPPWASAREGYANRGTANDGPPRDVSRERQLKPEDRWGTPLDRNAAPETGRPPWAASRGDYPDREDAGRGGSHHMPTPADSYPIRGPDRESQWSAPREGLSRREFAVEADGPPRPAPRDGYSNRGIGANAPSRDEFPIRDFAPPPSGGRPRDPSGERYSNRGFPKPEAVGAPPWAAAQRPEREERELRQSFSSFDAAGRRSGGGGDNPRTGSFGQEERDMFSGRGTRREQQDWGGRSAQPGPDRGPVGGGRFY